MGEHARIRRIHVSKLFGVFDYEIPLNLDERITIIHGPNGFGKTVILQMLVALFSGQQIHSVPFGEIVVEFEDGVIVRAKRNQPPQWTSHVAGVHLAHVHLINTQRLGSIEAPTSFGGTSSAVIAYSSALVTSIKSMLTTYAARSQELDSTFLDRLLEENKGPPLPLAIIEKRLRRIESKRAQLMALGFLDLERHTHKPPPKLDPFKLDVLSVYVDDTEKKLAVFDEMVRKVQLLTDTINKRFLYKHLTISKEEGFTFKSSVDSTPIPLASLSSGEQHELVLLYELLFKVAPDTLVLIDEPEISLHLAWQNQFLGDLIEMVKLSQFDVLIATHSPSIIGKRWDLTVELKGPELEHAAQ